MTIDDVRTLLEYHYWARDRMLDAGALVWVPVAWCMHQRRSWDLP